MGGSSRVGAGKAYVPAALVFLAGLVVTGLVAWVQARSNAQYVASEFDALSEATVERLFERMRRYEYGLRGARGSIVAMGEPSVRRFRDYHDSRDLAREFPGARGFGFVRRVPAEAEAMYLSRMRDEGRPEFALRQLTPTAEERYVIELLEPVERNRAAIGLDIGSEPRRRAGAERALATGEATITRPIHLVQTDVSLGFLVLLPIYAPGLPHATPEQRFAAGIGWSYAPLAFAEVMGDFGLPGELLTMSVADAGEAGEPPETFYGTPAPPTEGVEVRRLSRPVFGRTWEVELRAEPGFRAHLRLVSPWTVLAIGGVLSTLLAALFHVNNLGRARREQVVAGQLRMAAIVEHSSDAIVAETLDGVVTGWNRAAERIFGYTAEEALGRKTAELLALPAGRRGVETTLNQVRRGEAVEPFDRVCHRRDGTCVEVSITAAPITGPGGAVIGVGKTIRDIGARKEVERQLQGFNVRLEQEVGERTAQLEAARRELRTILDALPSMIGYYDASLTCRFANRAYRRWFGVDAQSLPGRSMVEVIGAGLFAANQAHIAGVLRGELQVFERAIPQPEGAGVRHALTHYIPDVVDGAVRGFYAMVHDITELTVSRQRLAAATRENAALLRAIRSAVIVSVTDAEGRILDVNEAFCAACGYEREALIGRDIRLIRSDRHDEAFWAELRATLRAGRPWRGEVCNRTREGSPWWTDTVVAPFFGDTGEIERFVAICTDITTRRAAADALREATRAAEAANAAKSEFLANMSHEIRTPLHAILGLTYLLERSPLTAEQQRSVASVRIAGQGLLGIVNDVLDLAKIETGNLSLADAPFGLRALIEGLREVLGPQAEAKGLTLTTELGATPPAVRGDETRLRQVLTNLLGNAIKFTERGGVWLIVTELGRDAGSVRLRFAVRDTGIGIAPEALGRLFQPFAQADASMTRRFGGTGLGLSIVRRLVERMGGEVGVRSEPGQGSEFRVEVSLGLIAPEVERGEAGPQEHEGPRLVGVRALVVDDNLINVEVARRVLMRDGAAVETRGDGAAALELLRARPGDFDVVLMDIQMPEMDGIEATARIRGELGLVELPILALTAGAQASERERALGAGMNDFISKPLDFDVLVRLLRRHVDEAAIRRAAGVA